MAKAGITPRGQDYAQWYLDIVAQADLADYSPVRGCMVIKPLGYAIWENIQRELDRRIKATGHLNAYFPLFIPMSFLQKEAEHVEGFAPEVAIVTRAGDEELAEPLAVRPTPEAIIGHSFPRWIHSRHDLPLLIIHWPNVARAFEIMYQTPDNRQEHAWTTSWGVSTRLVGALIMAHSDDDGLVVPPHLAPIQVVVVPIYREEKDRAAVMEAVERLRREWGDRFRVKVDARDELTPGFKFNEWELKGVPVRVEIGPRDVEKGTAAVARRDVPGKEGKAFVPQASLTEHLTGLLEEIQRSLFERALRFRIEHTRDVESYDELKQAVETGFARAYWAGSTADEQRLQDEIRATIRVIPFDQPERPGRCVYTG